MTESQTPSILHAGYGQRVQMEPDYHAGGDRRDAAHRPEVAVEPFEGGYRVVVHRRTGIRCEYYCRTEGEARQRAIAERSNES